MPAAPPHPREDERLRILDECEILDTPEEDVFDRVAFIAAQVCGCPISLVNFIDAGRQWFKAAIGTELRGSPREFAFCAHTILANELVEVDNALEDPRLADNPLVLGPPMVRFYAGVPLFVGPLPMGTLCVIDVTPRTLTATQRRALTALAREVQELLELRRTLRRAERLGEDRRQLASMIVHDMRSPLTVVLSGSEFVASDDRLSERNRRVVAEVVLAARRLQRMVRDLLDVSRSDSGRLEPIAESTALALFAEQVGTGLRSLASEHHVVFRTRFAGRIDAAFDSDLIRRMIENLVENAFKYAPRDSEIMVEMAVIDGLLRIDVSDHGPGIPPELREQIFEASFRLERDADLHARVSYGLGLRFCHAAAQAMGGRIWVEDNVPTGARFVVELPLRS
jgi:signal transduction histidine kinase